MPLDGEPYAPDPIHSPKSFVCLNDYLHSSQQFFGYDGIGLPGLNQY